MMSDREFKNFQVFKKKTGNKVALLNINEIMFLFNLGINIL